MASLPIEDLQSILDHTRPLWKGVKGKRIFITGGSGFFGLWLLESFIHINRGLKLGSELAILTRDPEAIFKKYPYVAKASEVYFLKGDIRQFGFSKKKYDYVIHAATDTHSPPYTGSSMEMADIIINGTRRALDFSVHSGAKKFLFISSGAIYGSRPPKMAFIPETFSDAPDPFDLTTTYGQSKRMAEHLCFLYANEHNIDCRIARCFAFVGPHFPLNAQFAIGNFIRDVLLKKNIRVQGDGNSLRSYMYASDLAIWLWTLLLSESASRVYNVGSDHSLSIKELAHLIHEMTGISYSCENVLTSPKTSMYVPSIQKAEVELGLKLTISVRKAIQKTLAWYDPQYSE